MKGATMSVGGAATSVGGAATSVGGAATSVGGAADNVGPEATSEYTNHVCHAATKTNKTERMKSRRKKVASSLALAHLYTHNIKMGETERK
jgi:hypothetical protein